jgi:hypothetical protein
MTHSGFESRLFPKLLLECYSCTSLLGIFSVENVKPERDLCVFVRNRRLKRAGQTAVASWRWRVGGNEAREGDMCSRQLNVFLECFYKALFVSTNSDGSASHANTDILTPGTSWQVYSYELMRHFLNQTYTIEVRCYKIKVFRHVAPFYPGKYDSEKHNSFTEKYFSCNIRFYL